MPQVIYDHTPDFYIEKNTGNTAMPIMHYHHAFEFYYLHRGEREYFIGDEFYKVGDGDIVLIPPNVLHRTAGKTATRFLINFSSTFMRRFFTQEFLSALPFDRPMIFRPPEPLRAYIENELTVMLTEYGESSKKNIPLLAGRLGYMLFRISIAPNRYTSVPYSDRRIGQIVRYINEHYNEIDDIEEIAEYFFIMQKLLFNYIAVGYIYRRIIP